MIKTAYCPICTTRLSSVAKVFQNRYVYSCKTCNLRRLLPLPGRKKLIQLYGRKEYYTNELAELHNDLVVNYHKDAPIINLYKKHISAILALTPPPASILEIGCARGVFLDLARKHGYEVGGIEMNPYAKKYAQTKFKLKVFLKDIEGYKTNTRLFDIIVAYDLVEHVSNPNIFFKKINSLLKPGGMIVIGTPNSDSLLYKISEGLGRLSKNIITYPLYRFYGRGVEHLTIFNKDNLKLLASKNGFIPTTIYNYSIPAKNITKVPLIIKPFIKYITSFPNEFVLIAFKRS